MTHATFLRETITYASRVRLFRRDDWLVYIAWVGMMYGLFAVVLGFLALGVRSGAAFPAYVWNVPLGVFIFSTAIAFDTIGHRTVYKEYLQKAEALVHHITIFAGITSVVLLCLAYSFPDFLRLPAYVFSALAVFYSVVDEAMHWHRYLTRNSDRVEMWSHFFIFVGHLLMTAAWVQWFAEGYPGVRQTLEANPWLLPL